MAQYADLLNYTALQAGIDVTMGELWNLNEALHIEREMGLRLPNWANETVLEALHQLGAQWLALTSPITQRLKAGMLIKELRNRLLAGHNVTSSPIENSQLKKLFVYSTVSKLSHLIRLAHLVMILI